MQRIDFEAIGRKETSEADNIYRALPH